MCVRRGWARGKRAKKAYEIEDEGETKGRGCAELG